MTNQKRSMEAAEVKLLSGLDAPSLKAQLASIRSFWKNLTLFSSALAAHSCTCNRPCTAQVKSVVLQWVDTLRSCLRILVVSLERPAHAVLRDCCTADLLHSTVTHQPCCMVAKYSEPQSGWLSSALAKLTLCSGLTCTLHELTITHSSRACSNLPCRPAQQPKLHIRQIALQGAP